MLDTAAASPLPFASDSLTVDDLAAMTVAEATAAYHDGIVPASLHALDGAPRGRMLAVAGLDRGPVAGRLRAFAASRTFPWAGKSFTAHADDAGEGINRLRLLGKRDLFKFETRIAPSAIDGQPCIVLDYEQPGNPWFIRAIHDELRQVGPDLYLGPAMWKTRAGPRLLLWFAIDAGAASHAHQGRVARRRSADALERPAR
jgi:hypothetical protein